MSKSWTTPEGAVEPANHFHVLYMRLVQIYDTLRREAGNHPEVLTEPLFSALLGTIATLQDQSARASLLCSNFEMAHPDIWALCEKAFSSEPPDENTRD